MAKECTLYIYNGKSNTLLKMIEYLVVDALEESGAAYMSPQLAKFIGYDIDNNYDDDTIVCIPTLGMLVAEREGERSIITDWLTDVYFLNCH